MALGRGADSVAAQSLGRLGDFEVLHELGRGGMGIVYEARQISLNRKVALKVLSGGLGLTAKAVARFKREAEAAAKLHHTNIVPIYATGSEDGTYFYAMELIAGPSLDKVIRSMPARAGSKSGASPAASRTAVEELTSSSERTILDKSPKDVGARKERRSLGTSSASSEGTTTSLGDGNSYFDTVARMVAEVADALDYAHKQGVIHRDMKPSNLLLSPDGRLSVNDFGLARILEEPGMTLSGEFVGSPLYMSPEQITAGRTPLDHRTDIYSLGATLYQMLTLEPPFKGESRDQILAQIIHKEPKRPRSVNRKIPLDLETICIKAMEKDPDRRYQSGADLAADLRRYLNRFAISARRAGPIARAVKWTRRHPAVAIAAAACIVFGLSMVGFAAKARRTEQEMMRQKRQRAFEAAFTVGMSGNLAAAENALKETEMTGVSVGEVRILRGLVEFQNGNLDKSIEELRQALKLLPQSIPARSLLAEAYNHSWRYSEYLEQAEQLEKIVPVTAEDHLFKGWAFANADAPSALQLLDQAIAMHDTPIARALRAEVRTMISFDGGTVKQAEQLLLDAAVALENLPNHPYVLYATLWSSVAAADIYGKAGDVRRRAEILEQASQYAKTLLPFVSLPDPAFGLWCYWNYLGDTKKILELMEPLAEQKRSPAFAYLCAVPLLGRGNPTKANDLLEPFAEVKNSGYDVLRALIAAERSGRSEAMQVYQTARTRHKNRSDLGLLLSIPFMLGESARGRADAREIRRTAPPLPRFQMQFDDQILRYYAGEISADELLGLAAAQKWKKGVFFAIGASSLGEKNRAKAKEYFQKVLETPAFGASVFDFAWVMTQRLESDPKWPAWAQ